MAGQYEDLGIIQSKDGDYFDVVIPNLDLSTEYELQVAWVYSDKTLGISEYSDPYTFVTTGEQPLNKPRFLRSDLTTSFNALIVNWSGLDYLGASYPSNFARVDIYVKGGTFGSEYVIAGSFEKAGKKTIIAQSGTYFVKLRAVSSRGTVSEFSDEWSSDTSNPGEVIEPPTLPIGLTVSTTAFGISVNWGGAYQANDPFSGFKTIQVYATTNAALGASTTTAFPSSALVSNLTVTQSLNRQNVGIDNLKQALGLTTSQGVYAANVYFYYIAYNKDNEPYKVAGVPTYTRISATPVSPTKANFIDLEDGTISIEKLVAGNGKFTSWLRTGSDSGGARIELNGGEDFPDGTTGRQILDGLTVYDTGNTPIFRASHTDGTVSFGTFSPSEIAAIKANAETKTKLFRQTTVPTSLAIGDLWINTADTSIGRNTIYIATKVGANAIVTDPALGWVVAKDLDINTALTKATEASNASSGFDQFGNINRGIQIPVKTGSIYSVKSSYDSKIAGSHAEDWTPGWFLGWDGALANSVPSFHIGNASSYLRWGRNLNPAITTELLPYLEIKGNIYGSNITGSTITGSTITTTNTGFNRIRLNSANSSFEFLNDLDTVTGAIYNFNSGEVIIQSGNKTALGYPSSSGYISVSGSSVMIGRTNSNGNTIGGLSVDSTSATFSGVDVKTIQGAPIGAELYYMRNIGMGTGPKTTAATDGYRGDIWIQYT
jgi:hypothetical protein